MGHLVRDPSKGKALIVAVLWFLWLSLGVLEGSREGTEGDLGCLTEEFVL